jgi:hypothetical protein
VASDLYVYNITKDKITVREAVTADLLYPPRPTKEYGTAKRSEPIEMSDFPNTGAWEKYVPAPMPKN